jgi:hypothetical protein
VPRTFGPDDGPTALDDFSRATIDPILASKAYADGGLVIVLGDGSAPDPAAAPAATPGALLISPFVKPGTKDATALDSFGVLGTIESLLGVKPLKVPSTQGSLPLTASSFAAWKPPKASSGS